MMFDMRFRIFKTDSSTWQNFSFCAKFATKLHQKVVKREYFILFLHLICYFFINFAAFIERKLFKFIIL